MLDLPTMTPAHAAPHALCVYAEPLVSGRRVVVVGDASLGLGARLADLGARIVHVYDPSGERVQWAARTPQRGVTVRDLPLGEFDVRDGAFDLAIVPDLASFPNAPALVARLRRLVGTDGALIAAAKNAQAPGAGGLDYYDLYDLLSMQFESVRMVGQVPFVGLTLAELGETDEAPQVNVDTQLVLASEPPEAFIAIGTSNRPSARAGGRLEPYTIVQLPAEAAGAAPTLATATTRRGDLEAELEAHRVALAEATLRCDLLVAQLEDARAQVKRGGGDEERVRALEARAGDSHVRAERLTHEIKRLEEELERQRERNFRLARDVEEEKKARQKAELELGMVRKSPELASARERIASLEQAARVLEHVNRELAAHNAQLAEEAVSGTVHMRGELQQALAQASDEHATELASYEAELADRTEAIRALEAELARAIDAHPQEIAEFEAALRERAQTIQLLEQEIVRREGIVRELVSAVEEAREHGDADAGVAAWANEAERARAEADAQIRELAARTQALNDAHAELAARSREVEEARAEAAAISARAAAQLDEMRGRLDALALESARREAELQTNAWRIAELEQRAEMLEERVREEAALRQAPTPPRELEVLAAKLAASEAARAKREDELDALRKALAQEHAARAQAESGEAVARARAEIERQAVLLEQLSRELDGRDRVAMTRAAEDAEERDGKDGRDARDASLGTTEPT